MNNKIYIEKLVKRHYNNIKADNHLTKLISEEYSKIKEDAGTIRNTLDDIGYDEKASEIDSGGKMQSHATKLFAKFFRFLKQEVPEAKIVITGGNDNFHQRLKIGSRHQTGEALDFIVKNKKLVPDVVKACRNFRSKNREFKYIDEYTHPSPHATGGHFHIAYIGSESVYDKTKPTRGNANPNTPGIDEPAELQSGVNIWQGKDDNGTDLAELDQMLATLADNSKGRAKAAMSKFRYGNEESHKWSVSAYIRVPGKELLDKSQGKDFAKLAPNKDGILTKAAPETIVFYPTGKAYFYNKMAYAGDVEIEDKNKYWKRLLNFFRYNPGMGIYAGLAWWKGGDVYSALSSKVITIYNVSGDLMGTISSDKKYGIVIDISQSPQFKVDADGKAIGTDATMDTIQTVLDIVGFIPVIGDIIDIINAIIYYFRGRYFEAALSVIAVIPVVGSVIKWGAKGAMKAGKSALKVGGEVIGKFNKLGFTKALFKKSDDGVKQFENIIQQLIDKNVLDAGDIKWLSNSNALDVISQKIRKSDKVFKRVLSDDQYKLMKRGIDGADGAFLNLKKAIKNQAGDAGKFIGPKGIAAKVAKEPTSWLGKLIRPLTKLLPMGRAFRYTKQMFSKLPPKRARLINDWISQQVKENLVKDPQALKTILRTLSPDALSKLGLGTIPKNMIGKIKPTNFNVEKIVDVAIADGNLFVRSMMNNPNIYFKSQFTQGLRSMTSAGGFAKVLRSSLGAKQLDVAYNEVSSMLNSEFGIDTGGYGSEQSSIIYYTLFLLFGDVEARKQRRTDSEGFRNRVYDMAGVLKFIGIDLQTPLAGRDQLEIADQMWNELPGDTDQDKLLYVKGQTTDPEVLKPILKYIKEKNKKDN